MPPDVGKADPQDPIPSMEPRPTDGPLLDGQSVAQGHVLKGDGG